MNKGGVTSDELPAVGAGQSRGMPAVAAGQGRGPRAGRRDSAGAGSFEASVLRSAPVPVLVLDTARDRWIFANPAAEELLGRTRDVLSRQGLLDVIADNPQAASEPSASVAQCRDAAARGYVRRCDVTLVDARRCKRWFEAHLSRTSASGGALVTCLLTDVEAQRLADRERAAGAETLRLVFESTREGFWDWDVPSGRVFFSDQWLGNLGYRPGDLPHRVETWQTLIHPDDAERAEQVLASRLEGRQPIQYSENRLRTKSGEYRWFADRGRVVERTDSGAALRMVGTDTDITDLKIAWEGKRRAEARLAQSERLASVGMMAAGVAHEINNPLAYILNNVEFARSQLADGPRRHLGDRDILSALSDAYEGAERVRAIVKDLRTFSRMGDEHQGWSNPREVLQSSLKIAKQRIAERAELVLDCHPTPRVHANRDRLGQVLLNLIVNAYEAIEPGKPKENQVVIRCRRDGAVVEISVSDTGSGISQADVPRIFDLFYTTKPVGVGTGLGLSICHNLVQAFGGSLHVETQLGEGTTFRLRLPHALTSSGTWPTASAANTPGVASASSSGIAPTLTLVPDIWAQVRRILIVDDDAEAARYVRKALLSQPWVTVVCERPSNAFSSRRGAPRLADARTLDSEIVLCDVSLLDAQSETLDRSLVRGRRLIFMTSGLLVESQLQKLNALGAPCIGKPLDADELAEAVRLTSSEGSPRMGRRATGA